MKYPYLYKSFRVNGIKVLTHRHIVELHFGRPLSSNEHVHHINGDRTDNRIENLMVVSPKQHREIEGSNISEETRAKMRESHIGKKHTSEVSITPVLSRRQFPMQAQQQSRASCKA